MVVERKAIPDLHASFASGRLYSQVGRRSGDAQREWQGPSLPSFANLEPSGGTQRDVCGGGWQGVRGALW
eukprot:366404-Chlamydomonas_euryale.AAC.14